MLSAERIDDVVPSRIAIRAGSGLGDSIYLQSVVRHMLEQGAGEIEVCSDFPDVFLPLKGRVTVSPFRRNVRHAHYAPRKGMAGTDQFQDCCIAAGISTDADLRLDWCPVNVDLVQEVRRGSRPVVVVQLPRNPMGRTDGFGAELLPDCGVIQRAIDRIKSRVKIVQVGKGDPLYRFSGIDLDLSDRTSVADLIDVACAADGFLGYVSFVVPLAESLGKPALLVWSQRGLNAEGPRREFVRRITPQKVLHCPSSRFVIDNCSDQELNKAADELLDQIVAR